jgi:hypothetical protein
VSPEAARVLSVSHDPGAPADISDVMNFSVRPAEADKSQ